MKRQTEERKHHKDYLIPPNATRLLLDILLGGMFVLLSTLHSCKDLGEVRLQHHSTHHNLIQNKVNLNNEAMDRKEGRKRERGESNDGVELERGSKSRG